MAVDARIKDLERAVLSLAQRVVALEAATMTQSAVNDAVAGLLATQQKGEVKP